MHATAPPIFVVCFCLLTSRSTALLPTLAELPLRAASAELDAANKVTHEGEDEEMAQEPPSSLFSGNQPFRLNLEANTPELVQRIRHHPKGKRLPLRQLPRSSMHNIDMLDSERLWQMRNGSNITWKEQREALARAGRLSQWCMLARDNWSCAGKRYTEVLKHSPMFLPKFRLEHWPKGFKLYAEGNSFFSQMIYSIMCESDADVWKISPYGNSMLAYSRASEASIFLLSNSEDGWGNNTREIISLLKDISFIPDAVALGSLNPDRKQWSRKARWDLKHPTKEEKRRTRQYTKAFAEARVVNYFGNPLRQLCVADVQHRCLPGRSHQCLPGPLFGDAMDFAADVLGFPVSVNSPSHGPNV